MQNGGALYWMMHPQAKTVAHLDAAVANIVALLPAIRQHDAAIDGHA